MTEEVRTLIKLVFAMLGLVVLFMAGYRGCQGI